MRKLVWTPLRRFNLVRTPEEQSYFLLEHAPAASLPTTAYSDGVSRAIKSVLALDSRTLPLVLDFRDGNQVQLNVILRGQRLIVNDKWLNFTSSHSESPCSLSSDGCASEVEINQFECTHILFDLYELILVELEKCPRIGRDIASQHRSLRSKAMDKLCQMPSEINAIPGKRRGEIEVSWSHRLSETAFKRHKIEYLGRVVLYRESSCCNKRNNLLSDGMFLLICVA